MRTALMVAVLGTLAGCLGGGGRPTAEGTIVGPDGVTLQWAAFGAGPDTVLVVHGGMGLHHRYLAEPLAPLAAGRTLIMYDMRGRGRSSAVIDSTLLGLDRDVADLEAVRAHFGLARPAVIGHHWGAAVAANYAVDHPDHVARLLLLSPFPVHYSLQVELTYMPGDSARYREALANAIRLYDSTTVAATCPSAWLLFFGPWRTDTLTPYAEMAPSVCDAPAARLADADRIRRVISRNLGDWAWRERLNGLAVPALVVEGLGERRVEVAAVRWAQHLPDARVLLLKPPFLFPWVGEPARFASAAGQFLAGNWPDGSVKPPAWQP